MSGFWRKACERTKEVVCETMGSHEKTPYSDETRAALARYDVLEQRFRRLQTALWAVGQPDPVESAKSVALDALDVSQRHPNTPADRLAEELNALLQLTGRAMGNRLHLINERCVAAIKRYRTDYLSKFPVERGRLQSYRLDLDAQKNKQVPDQGRLRIAQANFDRQQDNLCRLWEEAERAALPTLDKIRLFIKADLEFHRRCVAALEGIHI